MKGVNFMKKLSYLIILTLILGLILTGCSLLSNISQVPATEQSGITYLTKGGPTVDDAESFPLYAGQDWLVGEVLVWDDGEELCVRYELSEVALADGWLLYETHLAVGHDVADIPQTKKGNPIPGQFLYGNDKLEGVDSWEICIPFDELGKEESGDLDDIECGNILIIAAHAAIEKHEGCNEIGDVYGIKRNSGEVYGVDVLTGETALIFTTVAPPTSNVGPNGLAYDGENKRFYYCDYTGTRTLYFWDGTQELVAGPLPYGNIAAADFDDGKYYFITGPPPSDDLYEVTFDANGYIASITKLADIADNEHGWNFSGDIAVKDGIVYGWGLCGKSGHGYEFFTYDLGSVVFAWNKTAYQQSLQLAFGLDGELYGHRSGNPGNFYVIDTTNGGVGSPVCNTNNILFTDCASGAICEPIIETETAWGATEQGLIQFAGKNWATYFNYTVQYQLGCPCIFDNSGNIEELDSVPTDVSVEALVSDEKIRVWKEFEGALTEDLYYDLDESVFARSYLVGDTLPELYIPLGTQVCIYYVHYDQDGVEWTESGGINASITFCNDILGLIISGGTKGVFAYKDLMFAADESIGNPLTTYPDIFNSTNHERGFDVRWVVNTDDAVFNGDTVNFNVWVAGAHDSFRVILPMVPVPCE
jgi:hypothetical protein